MRQEPKPKQETQMTKRTYPIGHCRMTQNGWVTVEDEQEPKQDNGMLVYLAAIIVLAAIGAYALLVY